MIKNIKKIISCIALTTMVGTMLIGCGGTGSSKTSSGDTIITYSIWDKIQEPGMRQIADEFEKENPGIKVEINEYKDNYQKIVFTKKIDINTPLLDRILGNPCLITTERIIPNEQ